MYRKKRVISRKHLVVIDCGRLIDEDGEKYAVYDLFCLDTKRMVDGECPVVWYVLKDDKIISEQDYATDFWELFNKENEELYMEEIQRMQEAGENNDLPEGMGFGQCWMVIDESSQKAVVEALLQDKTKRYEYREGLQKVAEADDEENIVAVTATYKEQNYIIGGALHQFFYQTEVFLDKLKAFPRVYVYMTEHVSETHGFALIEYGKVVRLFSYDENEIRNIGKPLPEEIALSYRLPKNFEEERSGEENFTEVNEDMIVALAIQQVGIDVEQYPYKKVVVGKLEIDGTKVL